MEEYREETREEARSTFGRREFLAGSAVALIAPSVAWADSESCQALTLGYCGDEASTVVPAERLRAGDRNLERQGVRLEIDGLVGDAERLARMGIRSLDLTVHYELADSNGDGVDVRAWSYQLLPVEQNGSPNGLMVPVDGGLRLALEIETPLGVERRQATVVTGGDAGLPKLRTGRYLISTGDVLPRRFDADGSAPLVAISIAAI